MLETMQNRWLSARSTQTAAAAAGLGQQIDGIELRLHHRRDHHLRDALAAANRKRFRAVIDQDDLDLAAIVGIDGAGRVQHGDAVLRGEPRAWPHLRLEAFGQRDRKSCRHHCLLAGRKHQRRAFRNRREQIEPGRMPALIGRQRQAFAMRQLADVDLNYRMTCHDLALIRNALHCNALRMEKSMAEPAERMKMMRQRRRSQGLRELRLIVADPRSRAVRRRVAKQVAGLDSSSRAQRLEVDRSGLRV